MDGLSRREALLLLFGLSAEAALAASCGAPPQAQKQHWKSAESFPPLPLPVTPLRRSEKKRPPAPPALMGKLQYGANISATDASGKRYSYRDWTTDPNDARAILNQVNSSLKIRYRPQEVDFNHFSFQPQELPILYLTGHEGVTFSDDQRKKLRQYLDDGGFLLGDACCGSPDYRKAFLKESDLIFPKRRMKLLPADHPIYTAYHTITEVGYLDDEKSFNAPPALEGVSIGCREAVILSQYDLSCGWDGHKHPTGKRIWPAQDAIKLGVNILAYSLATYRLGLYLASTIQYSPAEKAADGLSIGQIIHSGDWNPNPSAMTNLQRYADQNSTLAVKYRTNAVSLRATDLQQYPVLYMTGHDDFTFTSDETSALRAYLGRGGTLLADSCCGRLSFDTAFRREMKKVLGDVQLKPIAPDHPVFRLVMDTTNVEPTPALQAKRGKNPLKNPEFEAVANSGGLSILYSRYGLGCGWEDEECPYCLGYSPHSSRALGTNILAYLMSH